MIKFLAENPTEGFEDFVIEELLLLDIKFTILYIICFIVILLLGIVIFGIAKQKQKK